HCISTTKANITKMEPLQRNTSEMERQNSTQQRHLALLAYAIYQKAKHVSLSVCISTGSEHARQTRGCGFRRKILEAKLAICHCRIQEMENFIATE
ncbi:hypothetical protein L9F63_028129, partial [Diploptera punctata]